MTDNTLNKKSPLQRIFKDNLYCWVSMLCAGLIMLLVYFCFELFPFGEVTILRMDLYHQYGPLFAEFYDRVTGLKSFIYSWTSGMGGPFLGNYFNYLSSPWAIIMLIFGHKNMPEAIAAMIFAKAVCSAGSFTLFLKKSQGRHDFTTAAFGLLYSMCGYFVAYYWNVMWIDAMVYFPMVMYGIEKIVNKRRPGVYIVSLALTLISNYYMGYMTCIFSVLFFITYYIMKCDITALADNTVYYYDAQGNKKYSFIEKVKGSLLVRSGVTFALGSLAAGALVAVALIPTVVILKSCSATSGSWPSGYRIYFSVFDFLANHLASVDPTIRSSGEDVLPNVFCGMGTLILVPLYVFSKRISVKEKIVSIFTLGLLYASFSLNYLNYVWHGFHFPNDLPYRFSYMYCFVLLVLAYKAFCNLSEYTGRQILGSGVAVVIMVVMVQEIGSKNVEDITVLLSIVFAVTYCLVFYLLKDVQKQKTAIAVILLCCVIAELACSNTDRYSMSQTKSSYTGDYDDFRALKAKIDKRENGDDTYRMDLTYNRARMDPCWYGYNGISTFSSMAYEKFANMQSNLGVYSNYINSYTYYLQTPVYNMMNAVKYVVDNDESVIVEDDYYTKTDEAGKFTAYENKYYLPIAMAVNDDLKEWYSAYTNPFSTQGEWFKFATGVDGVFDLMQVSDTRYYNINEIESGFETGDVYYSKTSSGEGEITAVLTCPETHHCYLFVDSDHFEEITVYKGDKSKVQSIDEPYILDLGIVGPEDKVEVTINIDKDADMFGQMDFFPYYVNDEKLAEGYEILKSGAINIETFKETYIKGTIKAEKDQIVFTSIPYDKGWSVKIDGKAIKEDDYISLENAYLCFSIPEGEHTVELKFTQRGLLPGAAISLAALIILIAVYFIVKKKRPDWDRRYEEKCEKALADYENMKEEMRLEAERIRELDIIPDEFMADLPEGEESFGETVAEGSETDNPAESTGDYSEEETAVPESPAEQEQEEVAFSDESGIPQIPEEQTGNTDAPGEEPETDGE